MKNEFYSLIQKGYFPKELPPAFNTYTLAAKYDKIMSAYKLIKNDETIVSKPIIYSISKNNYSRRFLSIVNPLNFIQVANLLVNNIDKIRNVTNQSSLSESKPVTSDSIKERCYRASSIGVASLDIKKLNKSIGKKIELKIDLSKYYPSVYTHSISWALLGKDVAKKLWKAGKIDEKVKAGNANAILYRLGNDLDITIRNGQDKQTMGIPIGPDTSFVIGELILARIDISLKEKFSDIMGCRYYDDYSIYVNTKEDAYNILKYLQIEFNKYGLEVNESKVSIKEFPQPFVESYTTELASIKITEKKDYSQQKIKDFFNVMWRNASQNINKKSQIFRYGLTILINNDCTDIVSPLYEDLLYRTGNEEPAVLSLICSILRNKLRNVNHPKLKLMVDSILHEHIPMRQTMEVSWALWICKEFNIEIGNQDIIDIFKMGNSVCSLILLDILYNKYPKKIKINKIKETLDNITSELNNESLHDHNWLLIYEGTIKGWINKKNVINKDPFFSLLFKNNVSFYDSATGPNYFSYEYIEQLPYKVYTADDKKRAKNKTKLLIEKIKDSFMSEIDDEVLPKDKINLSKEIDNILSSLSVYNKIYDCVISRIFKGEEICEEEIIDYYISEINDFKHY